MLEAVLDQDQKSTQPIDEITCLRGRVDQQRKILQFILDGRLFGNLGGRHGKIRDFLHRRHLECEGYRQVLLRGPDELELISTRFYVQCMERTIALLVDTSFDLERRATPVPWRQGAANSQRPYGSAGDHAPQR